MNLAYLPFRIAGSRISARIGQQASTAVWQQLTGTPAPPSPTDGRHSLPSLAVSAAIDAALIAAAAAVIDQLTARAFHQLFGGWPDSPAGPNDPDAAEHVERTAAIQAT